MHVKLTDVLTCPRCGPEFGLILVPDAMRDRRVVAGVLGCPNCRERWPIVGGVADFSGVEGTPEDGGVDGDGAGGPSEASDAVRIAGLLGLAEAGGVVLVPGATAETAMALSALVPDAEVVTVAGRGAAAEVSAMRLSDVLPFRSGSLTGVALGRGWAAWLEEAARVVAPGRRLLLDPAPPDAGQRLEAAGLRVLAAEGATVVAVR